MKKIVLTGIREMKTQVAPDPNLTQPHEVLLRLVSVGVCGSDIHYYKTGRIGSQVVEYPFAVGHECAGIVEQVGDAVTRVAPGDRVAVDPAMPCFECDQCKAGRMHTCRNLRFLGCPGQAEGCLSDFIVMPETSLFPIADDMSLEEAVISEPLAIGVYGVKQAQMDAGAQIGILGMGPIGLSVLLAAKAYGSGPAYCTDKLAPRLEIARQAGADWTGNPDEQDVVKDLNDNVEGQLDIVFECCGQQDALDQAIEVLRPGGKLLLIGIPEADRVSFEIDKLRRKEISIINVRRQNECVEETLELIRTGKVDVQPMITHRFAFQDTDKAFELVADYSEGVMKAMITFNGS